MCTLEGGSPGVMINKVLDSLLGEPHLPSKGEGELVCHGKPGILPLGSLTLVVHKVDTSVRKHAFL